MKHMRMLALVIVAGALIWGCVEELDTGRNRKPNVWFTRGPLEGRVIFQNSADFEWMATDFDDDLGMGAAYVKLEPFRVPWFDIAAGSTVVFEHAEGWVRVYENDYQILDLPDSNFEFSVRIVDGRGADSTIARHFIVRFDDRPPIIDSVICPPQKPPKVFPWEYIIYAHDVARSPRAATPKDSLEYSYAFRTPCERIESDPEWSTANDRFAVFVDGQSCPGDYTFRCKVRDRAWNVSEEFKCEFTIEQ